jgi:hypothetical protein
MVGNEQLLVAGTNRVAFKITPRTVISYDLRLTETARRSLALQSQHSNIPIFQHSSEVIESNA